MKIRWILAGALTLVLLLAGSAFLVRVFFPRVRLPGLGGAPAPTARFNGSEVILSGRVESTEVVAVPVPFDGTIDVLQAEVGQDVFEGQLLARIHSTGVEASKETAKADLDRLRTRVDTLQSQLIAARADASKTQEAALDAKAKMDAALKEAQKQQVLMRAGAAGKLAADKAQAQYETASSFYDDLNKLALGSQQKVTDLATDLDAQMKTLDEKLTGDTDASAQAAAGDITAPADGYVVARNGDVGGEVTKDSPELYRIATNLSTLRIVAPAPAEYLAKIQVGQPVVIQIAEIPQGIEATVTEVRAGEIWVDFPRPSPLVKPGLTVVVRIKVV